MPLFNPPSTCKHPHKGGAHLSRVRWLSTQIPLAEQPEHYSRHTRAPLSNSIAPLDKIPDVSVPPLRDCPPVAVPQATSDNQHFVKQFVTSRFASYPCTWSAESGALFAARGTRVRRLATLDAPLVGLPDVCVTPLRDDPHVTRGAAAGGGVTLNSAGSLASLCFRAWAYTRPPFSST